MPSKNEKLKQSVGKILGDLSKAEGEVKPQERFSSVGTDFGDKPVARAAVDLLAADEVVPALPAAVLAPEPVFEEATRKDIQGNILPGFNKDYQHFLFYRIGTKVQAKKWLQWIAPLISSMDEVLAFNRMYRTLRFKLASKDVPVKATWVNIALSCAGIAALTSKDTASAFGDESFSQGLSARSEYLGDPTKPGAPGQKEKWVVGGPGNEADILVIVASDRPELLKETVKKIQDKAVEYGLKLLFEQPGETLPGSLRGHEHFGFKDGISQPGVRGRVSSVADDYLTPRYIQTTDPRSRLFARPGQLLVWSGQFLLGMQRQNPEDFYTPVAAASDNFPDWARLGSYLVCRRLRQNVMAFWEFAVTTAAALGVPAQKFAAMLVGRFPSGAPVSRTRTADIPALGADDLANNHFLFDDDTRPSSLIPIPGYPGDTYTQAQADFLGLVCPHFGHIRKVNPRDSSTDLGKVADSLIRMIMRRGIPFGRPIAGIKNPPPGLVKKERGLMFLCYQSSIEDQFEFLTRRWSNSTVQPNFGGHDPIIGQQGSQGIRARFIDFPVGAGKFKRVDIKAEWVIPTGGGYFFAPPISALAGVLGS